MRLISAFSSFLLVTIARQSISLSPRHNIATNNKVITKEPEYYVKFNSTQDDENARLLKAIKDLETIASHSENKVLSEQDDEASSEDSSFFNLV